MGAHDPQQFACDDDRNQGSLWGDIAMSFCIAMLIVFIGIVVAINPWTNDNPLRTEFHTTTTSTEMKGE